MVFSQTRAFFKPGTEVYFKRTIDQKLRGLGIVIGQDEAIVFLRQVIRFIRHLQLNNK